MSSCAHYPRGVPWSINYPEIPLHAFLENSARKYPERAALVFYGNKISYRSLWEQTRRFAAALRDLGLVKGERVGLLLPNVPQFVIAYYATLYAGGVVVAVNPLNPMEEIGREFLETEARILVVLDRFLGKMPPERPPHVVVVGAEDYLPSWIRLIRRLRGRIRFSPDFRGFEELVEGRPLESGERIDPRRDLAVIQYTAGTTGPPKGVMLTHFSLVANALQAYHWLRGWGYGEKPQPAGHPVVVCAVPFFHIYGMTVALNEAVQFGSTLVLVPDPKPEAIMEAVQRNRATHLPAIPQMIRGIVDHPKRDGYNLRSLTSCVSGGAAMEPSVARRFVEMTGAKFFSGYGLTEAGPVTHCTPCDSEPKPGSVGLALPDTEAKIVDVQLGEVELQRGEEGELAVRGPQVMAGYWRDPEGTSKALREGWLHTGDIAFVDEEGYLHVVDRKQEQIISSGHTVWPSRVEGLLATHPSVEEAVVIGVPDLMRCATDLRAVVTLRKGYDEMKAEKELLELCRARLEPHQVPSLITVLDTLPRNPIGKIDRRAIRAELERLKGLNTKS